MVLALLAVPLSRTTPRQGRYAKLFTAIVVCFIYINAVSIAQKLVERGELHPIIGVWSVHLCLVGIALLLLYAQSAGRWKIRARLRALRRKR